MLPLLVAYAFVLAASLLLKALYQRHLRRHGHRVPAELDGVVDQATLARMSAYAADKSRLETIELLVNNVLVALFLFGGWLGVYDEWVAGRTSAFVWSGLLFFMGLYVVESVARVPFSAVRNFGVEKRYGFNRMGPRLWWSDQVKSLGVGAAILGVVISGALLLVQWSPDWWWLWVWGFFLVFSLFLLYVSPYWIEPLFFKLEPVRSEGLEDAVRDLLAGAGLSTSRVFQVDASRRSTHSNAYFTGVGRVKRIVLFDTLVEQLAVPEILGILAHEAGHWKRRHVLQRIVATESVALVLLFVASRLLPSADLPGLIGLESASFHARVVILAFVGSLASFPLTPLSSWWARRHEWDADRFAAELTRRPEELATALAKLSRDNLANLHPHPLYSRFYHSHPPVVDRIRSLRQNPGAVHSLTN